VAVSDLSFQSRDPQDNNFFLLYVTLIWVGVVMGFTPGIVQHFEKHRPPYALIVHMHAAAFVGWLLLLTVQIALIRAGKVHIHRSLGILGACIALSMLILGPATALYVHRVNFGLPNQGNPPMLSVQLGDIVAFAGLITPALLLRARSDVHKRLMLLATLAISDAGFNRWLGDSTAALFGNGFSGVLAQFFLTTDILVVGMGCYDLWTRKRLLPAYLYAVAWIAFVQLGAIYLLRDPEWKPLALRLIGQ
jgi:hypothetical protein